MVPRLYHNDQGLAALSDAILFLGTAGLAHIARAEPEGPGADGDHKACFVSSQHQPEVA